MGSGGEKHRSNEIRILSAGNGAATKIATPLSRTRYISPGIPRHALTRSPMLRTPQPPISRASKATLTLLRVDGIIRRRGLQLCRSVKEFG